MRILHYFLGFPPYRTGGMTAFAYDLMCAQIKKGDEVCALWPGQMKLLNQETRFRERIRTDGIKSMELINPLPVPLDEGVKAVDRFTRHGNKDVFLSFLQLQSPDVIHIHTLMGLYAAFMEAANELKIRTVFTTHDYFGICPKVTLYRNGAVCDDDENCGRCASCNQTALSVNGICFLQSPLYRRYKDSKIIKRLRKIHRDRFFSSPQPDRSAKTDNPPATEAEAYRCLRAYHCDILNRMDLIHFNSALSRQIYLKYISPENEVVLPVSREGIRDLRNQTDRGRDDGKCIIVYLASMKPYKGFTILQQALDELWSEGNRNFELLVFSRTDRMSPYLKCHEEGYNRAQLNEILQQADVLVAPSIWYETYGFTVLEALSHGVPVIVSDHVGAKDLVNGFGRVVPAGDVPALKEAVRDCIADMGSITEKKMAAHVIEWEQFVDDCYALYREDDRKCRTVL